MSPSDSERELVWKAYCELGLIERHHGGTQSSYRTLASTWMLAAFAGIGFVISQDLTVDIAGELLVAAIALGCGVGLYLLWVLDLLVTQRLLDAAYIEARRLESIHAWLPQPRNNMRFLLQGKGLAYVVRFYIVGMEVMVCIVGTRNSLVPGTRAALGLRHCGGGRLRSRAGFSSDVPQVEDVAHIEIGNRDSSGTQQAAAHILARQRPRQHAHHVLQLLLGRLPLLQDRPHRQVAFAAGCPAWRRARRPT